VNVVKQFQYQTYAQKLAKKLNLKPAARHKVRDSEHPDLKRFHKRKPPNDLTHPAAIRFALSGKASYFDPTYSLT